MNFIVDRSMPDGMINELLKLGGVYKSAYIDLADKSVSSHPDLQIHFIDDEVAVCAPEVFEYYRNILPENISIKQGSSAIGRTYPFNCAYNIARVGEFVICNTKYADKYIMDYYNKNGFRIIHINQGYAKCNICPISENMILTEDAGIFKIIDSIKELNVFLIEKGKVRLDGFDYGFIGGASGQFEKKILFCGCIEEDIAQTLAEHNIEYIELSNDKLYDYGSILSFR